MPQLDQIMVSYASQIVALVIVLAIIYFGIARAMLPKVQETIDARAKRISDDLKAADAAHDRADEIEEGYRTQMNAARNDAHQLTVEAKAKAAAASEKRVAEANAKLDEKMAEAEARLDEARRAALTEIEGVAVEATRDIFAKIAGGSIGPSEAEAAVKEAMARG